MKYIEDIVELDDYQEQALDTDSYSDNKFNIEYKALGLYDEAEKVSDKIKKVFKDYDSKLDENKAHEIAKELGDCLWYISRIAAAIGFELSDIAKLNVDKLSKRKTEGKLHGSGDNR